MFFGIADYPAFALAILIFLLIPGPGNLALVTSTGKGGIRAGLAAGMGIILGDQILLWLLASSPTTTAKEGHVCLVETKTH
jgi:threonine/homoserine/homoserine lactone efflux protein